ncbi:hypothetical protein SAMN04487902_103185 [Prevotella sp. ne3005]|nr:hypothetical protein SAMN04487902_103185 [Prevotella sp. ne3005]
MKKDIVKSVVTSEDSILSEMEMINVLGGDGDGNNSNTKCSNNRDCSSNGTCEGNTGCHGNKKCKYLYDPLA